MIRILIIVVLVLAAISIAVVVAIFTGLISFPHQSTAVSTTGPSRLAAAAQGAPQAAGGQNRPAPKVVAQQAYGDWVYTCLEAPGSKAVRCSIAQQLAGSKTKGAIFSWRIGQDGKGGLVSVWQTPRTVLLNRGITVDAGWPKPIAIPFETCGQRFCRAVAGLKPDYVAMLATAEKATVTIVLRDGKAVNLGLSVKGLGDALAALQAQTPAVAQ